MDSGRQKSPQTKDMLMGQSQGIWAERRQHLARLGTPLTPQNLALGAARSTQIPSLPRITDRHPDRGQTGGHGKE